MSFTQDDYIGVSSLDGTTPGEILESENGRYKNFSTNGRAFYNGKVYTQEELEERIKQDNLFAEQDYAIIIKAFEVETSNWQQEDYNIAYHYKDVYSTRNFSSRVRQQMNYYPGMHQITGPVEPGEDPFYTEAKRKSEDRLGRWDSAMDDPTSFQNALRTNQKDFDYTKIFGSETNALEKAKELGKMLGECIPCFNRVIDPAELLPDGDLLEIHALNIKVRTDLLDKLKSMFNDPGLGLDLCEVLNLLSGICPADLLAMSILLTQYLAKLNLDIKFNLDFIIQLIGPILSPFLDAIADWLDMWIQLILEPMICVIDHINEVIITTQQAKIPLSQVTGSIESDIGLAGPSNPNIPIISKFPGNVSNRNLSGFNLDLQHDDKDIKAGLGTANSFDVFKTPDKQKYNPSIPDLPKDEIDAAAREVEDVNKAASFQRSDEVSSAFSPGISALEQEERDKRWTELRAKHDAKINKVPTPLKHMEPADGTRWSKDNVPESEKYSYNMDWSKGSYKPPERQTQPKGSGTEYFVTTPLVMGVVQLRNVVQAAVEYVRDWFTYITQMVYDLLGTDIGWMQKKTETTQIKSKIIQIIMFIAAILEAKEKNGLHCGEESDFDTEQLTFVTEEVLTKNDPFFDYHIEPSGDIAITSSFGTTGGERIEVKDGSKQKAVALVRQEVADSSIIIKSCFKDVSSDELAKAREWIADFEERGGS